MAYLEEARRISDILPTGRLEEHESPDFLILSDSGTLGIEVTELCREEPRAEAGRLSKVPRKARELYARYPQAEPVDVSVAFWRAEQIQFNVLIKSLADFVYANRAHKRKEFCRKELPPGFIHIGIFEPLRDQPTWHACRAFDTVIASKELVKARIEEKNKRVKDYKISAPEVWLLIVNDQFLGPGEVCVSPDHLAQWKFPFDFERVLLFMREPGGTGNVIDIART